jgi:hypothetical protein
MVIFHLYSISVYGILQLNQHQIGHPGGDWLLGDWLLMESFGNRIRSKVC